MKEINSNKKVFELTLLSAHGKQKQWVIRD